MDSINKKTAIGLDENIAGVLTYSLGWITGLAFLVVERENRFVRFHAIQSTLVFGTLCVLWFVGVSIPIVGWLFAVFVIPPMSVFIWWVLMFKLSRREIQAAVCRHHRRTALRALAFSFSLLPFPFSLFPADIISLWLYEKMLFSRR
jgi:uncharacterized membrane protein